MPKFICFLFLILPKDTFIDFREMMERETERDRETSDQLPPVHSPTGDRTCNLGMCPDWELANFWCTGQHSNQLSHPARTVPKFLNLKIGYEPYFTELL